MGLSFRDVGGAGLAVVGELDQLTAPMLAQRLRALGTSPRLELSECSFIDSSGLAVLLEANEASLAAGGSMALIAPSASVTRLFAICGLTEFFEITSE